MYALYGVLTALLLFISVALRLFLDRLFPYSQLPFQSFIAIHRPYFAPFSMVLFWLAFSLLYQLLVNRYAKERKYLARLHEFSIAQNEFLKHQINPHFLFNNLNNIYSLIQTGSPHASGMVLRLSALLRYSLYKTSGSKISVKEELDQVKNLIKLYQLKENNSLNIKIDETSFLKDAPIEPMLLIPLIENCFKHGNIITDEKSYIYVTVISNENRFSYIVENSISSSQKKTIGKEGGIGLTNIKKRLNLIYGEQALLEFEESQDSFKVILTIQWKLK